MNRMRQVCFSLLALIVVVTFGLRPTPRTSAATSANLAKSVTQHPVNQAQAEETYGKLPLSFEANQGQTDSRVKFLSRGSGYSLFLTEDGAVLSLHEAESKAPTLKSATTGVKSGATKSLNTLSTHKAPRSILRMKLVGANTSAAVIGADELPGKANYFIGNDPKKWRTNVPTYAKVRYSSIYTGVDLIYYGNEGGQLEYDFVVAPGADPNAIELAVAATSPSPNGGQRPPLQIAPNGDLILHSDGGNIRFQKPVVYQVQSIVGSSQFEPRHLPLATRHFFDGHYTLDAQNRVGFQVGAYDHTKPLVIDPAIAYSTPLGGTTGDSEGSAITTYADPSTGHVYAYVSGFTSAPDFPTISALQNTLGGSRDVFVTKFDPAATAAASALYSTYLGGAVGESPTGIAVDSGGDVYVTGNTSSTNFPTVNAYQTNYKAQIGGGNAFLAKLSADGSTLLYSTYFGGSVLDNSTAVALDSAGHAYIAGNTHSPDLPTVNPYQLTGVGFLAAFDTTRSGFNSLLYSSYLPADVTTAAVDGSGAVHLGGADWRGGNFPIVNGFQMGGGGINPSFYAKLNPSASGAAQLVYSTLFGGPVTAIAVDSAGNAYLTTYSSLVMKINPFQAGLSSLVYSTSLLNQGAGELKSIAVDASGNAFVLARTAAGLPLINPAIGNLAGVYQSVSAGQSWTNLAQEFPNSDLPILALVVDASTSPRTLYAGTGIGTILSSADGGLTWNRVFQAPSSTASQCGATFPAPVATCVMALAVDPTSPSNVYAGTTAGVYKSSDRGATWNPFNTGLSSSAVQQGVIGLTFDGGTLYAGAPDGLYKLSSGSSSWTSTTQGVDVGNIAIDPTTVPHIIYTSSPSSGLYKSADGGSTWTALGSGSSSSLFSSIAVDTSTSPPTLYVQDLYHYLGDNFNLAKSTDGGMTWTILPDPGLSQNAPALTIAFDSSQVPSTVYVLDFGAGIFKSADSGASWTTIEVGNIAQGAFALDPTTGSVTTPATLYAGSREGGGGAYVAELNPSGSAILFSTYLGLTFGTGVAVDTSDNIYITGDYYNNVAFDNFWKFPTVNAFQTSIGPNVEGAFLIELGARTLPTDSSGSVSTQTILPTGTLTITFPSITGSTTSSPPTLTVTPLSSATTANFSLYNNLGAYDISTTAEFAASPSNPVTICFQALTVNDFSTFSNLEILHIVNGSPVNVTTSYNFATRTICGAVTSFSPFVLVKGAAGQLNDLVRTVNESNLRHGIQNALDAKIQNAIGALNSAHNNSYGTVCNLMGAFISSVQAQEGQAITTGEATAFISAAKQIKATLGCQ